MNNKKTARRIVARHSKHGITKNEAELLGKISSLGTERNYRQCVSNFLEWCIVNNIPPDFQANILTLKMYLEERSEYVQQKTLNQERQALELVYISTRNVSDVHERRNVLLKVEEVN